MPSVVGLLIDVRAYVWLRCCLHECQAHFRLMDGSNVPVELLLLSRTASRRLRTVCHRERLRLCGYGLSGMGYLGAAGDRLGRAATAEPEC